MHTIIRRSRSLSLFLLIPGLAVIAPILVYPAITSRYGVSGFIAIAIGQSVGAAIATICELGWSVVGPQMVARYGLPRLSEFHTRSIATKLMALALGAPAAAAIGYLVPLEHRWASAATAVAVAISALSPSWLLTGLNRPGVILRAEVLPRMLLNLGAASAIFLGAPLPVFAVVNVASVGIALFAAGRIVKFRVLPRMEDFAGGIALVREHLPLTIGRSASVVYTSLLTTLIGAIFPPAVAVYAATDRLLRMGLAVLAGFPSRLQSWIGGSDDHLLARRSVQSLAANSCLGVAAGLAFLLLARPASAVLFSNTVLLPWSSVAIGAGLAVAVCVSRGLGLSLVAMRRANTIAAANIAAACGALVAVMTLVPILGADGGLLAALVGELMGVGIQAWALIRVSRRDRDWPVVSRARVTRRAYASILKRRQDSPGKAKA